MNPHEDHAAEQGAAREGLLRRVSVPRIARALDRSATRCPKCGEEAALCVEGYYSCGWCGYDFDRKEEDGVCAHCGGWWLDCGGCETSEDREPSDWDDPSCPNDLDTKDGWDEVQEDRDAGRLPRLCGGYIPLGH